MKSQLLIFILSIFTLFSCVSTKSTLKNVDNSLPNPIIKNNVFVLTEQTDDAKDGYDKYYPINVFYMNSYKPTINIERFLNALSGPNNAAITYSKLELSLIHIYASSCIKYIVYKNDFFIFN